MATQSGYDDLANLGVREPEDLHAPRHYAAVRRTGARCGDCRSGPTPPSASIRRRRRRSSSPSWNMLERAEIVPNAGRLPHHDLPRRAAACRPRQRREGPGLRQHLPPPRRAGRRRLRQLQGLPLPLSLLDLWPGRQPDRRAATTTIPTAEASDRRRQQGGVRPGARSRAAPGAASCSSGSSRVPRRWSSIWAPLSSTLASHRLEDMACARKVVYDMDANWKCFVENYIDGYHIPYVHKDSLARWKTESYVTPAMSACRPTARNTSSSPMHDGSQLLLPFPGYDGFPPMPQIDRTRCAAPSSRRCGPA